MRVYFISVFLLLSTLAGCSTSQKTIIDSIQIVAESGANKNNPTAIDIVFAYDSTVISLLPTTASVWFDKKTL
jgi:uncharacterized protein YcfL